MLNLDLGCLGQIIAKARLGAGYAVAPLTAVRASSVMRA